MIDIQRPNSPSPRQFVNDLLGARAFDRGDAELGHQPIEVHVQVASGCNLDCYMCSEHLRPVAARHGKHLQTLSEEIFARLEAEVFPWSSRVHFGVGGEPMLAPQLLGWIERARAAGQDVYLTTNGTRITTDAVAETLARCTRGIEISVDGATAATYERIRFGARFDVLQRNLARLERARLALAPAERTRVRLCFVILRSNVHELTQLVELAAAHGIDAVAAWHVIPVTEEGRAELVAGEPDLWVEHVERARARAIELGIEADLPRPLRAGEPDVAADAAFRGSEDARSAARFPEPVRQPHTASPRTATIEMLRARDAAARRSDGRGRVHCHMPTLALYVFYDGRVYPCGHPHVHAGTPMGNLGSQSFAEIWNGRAYRNLRAGLATGEAPPVCRSCAVVRGCDPVTVETPAEKLGADVVEWFGARDLAPLARSGARTTPAAAHGDGAALRDEERVLLAEHVRPLERECRALYEHARTLEREYAALTGHARALEAEREGLREHARALERDRVALTEHARALEEQSGRPLRHLRILLRRWLGKPGA